MSDKIESMNFDLVVDDVAFGVTSGGIPRVWKLLMAALTKVPNRPRIVGVSRTGELDSYVDQKMFFPEWRPEWAGHDRAQIELLVSGLNNPVFFSSYYTYVTNAPNMQFVYDLIPESEGFDRANLLWLCRKVGLSLSDWAFAISRQSQGDFEHYFPRLSGKTEVIPIGSDKSVFFPRPDLEVLTVCSQLGVRHSNYVLTLGGAAGYKNTANLIRAWISAQIPSQLVVVVSDTSAALRQWGEFSRERLIFVEADDDALAALYSGAQFFIQASRKEGFGLPLLESRMCGCPAIALSDGAVEEARVCPGILLVDQLGAEDLHSAFAQRESLRKKLQSFPDCMGQVSPEPYSVASVRVFEKASELSGSNSRAATVMSSSAWELTNKELWVSESRGHL